MDDLKQAIIRYANLHAGADGLAVTPVPGLRMMCVRAPTGPMRSIYKPLICLVLQGAKQMMIGVEAGEFSAGQSVLVTLDMPVTGRITQASRDKPYLALAVELDVATINEIVTELGLSQTQVREPAHTLLSRTPMPRCLTVPCASCASLTVPRRHRF